MPTADLSHAEIDGQGHGTSYDILAEFYDSAYGDRSDYVDFYGRLVGPGTRDLLELGCGTGVILAGLAERLSTPQADRTLIGLDNSYGMLAQAARRAPALPWVQGDLRYPPLARPFDVVVCCFNTLQHLTNDIDLRAALSAARALIGDEGRYAFDLYQPNFAYLSRVPPLRIAQTMVLQDGEVVEIHEANHYDADTRILQVDWSFRSQSGVHLARAEFLLRQWCVADIRRLLTEAGLAIEAEYGAFDRRALTPQSIKQIYVCRSA